MDWKCKHCKEEMNPLMVQQGGMHIECFNKEITVYTYGPTHHNHVTSDLDGLINFIKEMEDMLDYDETLEITKVKMTAGKYHHLPEFQGF